jgi:hypothetical protein
MPHDFDDDHDDPSPLPPAQARQGQDDDGEVVTSALGEPLWGAVADVTDDEIGRKKRKRLF